MTSNISISTRIHAENLSKHYGETVALDDVSLRIDEGESIAIMGPSGSGKTTLLHALAGIIRPDAGKVMLRTESDLVDIATLDDESRSALRLADFGFVFQQGLLIPELTALENVMLPLLLTGVSVAEAKHKAQTQLDRLGLMGKVENRPGQLSGGQIQRVAIARAVVAGAKVIFADEPTGALDSHTAAEVLDVLLQISVNEGCSLVIVTHDENVAARCSRIIRVLDGRIVGQEDCV